MGQELEEEVKPKYLRKYIHKKASEQTSSGGCCGAFQRNNVGLFLKHNSVKTLQQQTRHTVQCIKEVKRIFKQNSEKDKGLHR